MKRHYDNPYRERLRKKITHLSGQVFERKDLTQDQSNTEQLRLNRALNAFIDQGLVMKISHGLYAKAMPMTLPNGQTRTVLQDSFESVAIEALNKLGLQWEWGEAIQAYNQGETTQIPSRFSVKLHSRFRGTIQAEGRSVVFEGDINAR